MIRNYFLIAIRNLWRNKLVTLINILGMAIGFGIFLSLASWVRFDKGFDRFHKDFDRICLLRVTLTMNGSEYTADRTGGIFASVLRETFPQIESSCRVSQPQEFELGIPQENGTDVPMKFYDEREVLAVDSGFLKFFTFPLVSGNIGQIFTERDHIVITESLAKKLFGGQPALNRQLKMGEGGYFTVVGVVEDPPVQSSVRFNALVGFHIMEELGYPVNGYDGTMFYNFFKMASEKYPGGLDEQITQIVKANSESDLQADYFLEPFRRFHLYGETRSIVGVVLNLIMSLIILFIACINFINLTTAFASGRIKEIAVRKSVGASKRQLILQFMGETYLLLLVAFYLGLFISEHLVPETSRVFGVNMDVVTGGLTSWIQVLAIFILTGMLAGLYPAIKIAGYRPAAYLAGKAPNHYHEGSRFRKLLIVVQFTFSVVFVLSAVFIIRQYNYLMDADLGFNRKDVIYIRTKGKAWDRFPLIKSELEQLPFVEKVSAGSEIPVMIQWGEIDWGEREGEHNRIARILSVDPDFLETFEVGMQEGTFFTPGRDSLNQQYVVVNRALVDLMGWKDPIGMPFTMWDRDLTVLGVTDNFNFFPFNLKALDNEALIYLYDDVQAFIFVRVQPGVAPDQVSSIEKVFQKHNPGYEFEYNFVSDYKYTALESAEGIKFVFRLFSVVAIFIAAMGLVGLSLYNSNRRTKEVGVRKAMGAHSGIIMRLLLSDFLKLVALSNLIAIPVAYLILKKALSFFSYSTDLKATVFLAVIVLSLLLSLVTVSFHAWMTARTNPADSLRYE
jgi:putative ABC transport system permease protein